MSTFPALAVMGGVMGASGIARACPFEAQAANADAGAAARTEAAPAPAQATPAAARSVELIGANCSYTTAVAARRVVAEGADYSFVGSLIADENDLGTGVAAPFRVGMSGDVWVVATDLLERMVSAGDAAQELALQGKMLTVDGRRLLVLTDYRPLDS
jgi:hypothetical protein